MQHIMGYKIHPIIQKCLKSVLNQNISERQATEDEIKENCNCEYGLLHKHQQDKHSEAHTTCNFTQRVRCVNKYVIDYITDDHALSHCLPECNRIDKGIST